MHSRTYYYWLRHTVKRTPQPRLRDDTDDTTQKKCTTVAINDAILHRTARRSQQGHGCVPDFPAPNTAVSPSSSSSSADGSRPTERRMSTASAGKSSSYIASLTRPLLSMRSVYRDWYLQHKLERPRPLVAYEIRNTAHRFQQTVLLCACNPCGSTP